MAFINTDWEKELDQVKSAVAEIVDEQIGPLIKSSIAQSGKELSQVVTHAGEQVQAGIRTLSKEIHDQRRLTKDELVALIDYASAKIGSTIDTRLTLAKEEASSLIGEKFLQIKAELEDSAIRSRKILYFNVTVSVGAAVAMAAVGIIYKKISLGELDVLSLFRVLLLSLAVGAGMLTTLKAVSHWRSLSRIKKNIATTLFSYMGLLRPNGALGLFAMSVGSIAAWFYLTYFIH